MKVYKDPRDIDLIAGLWGEKYVKGGKIPETLYCLLVEQLKRTVQSDRHWYERHNRPRAFTEGNTLFTNIFYLINIVKITKNHLN